MVDVGRILTFIELADMSHATEDRGLRGVVLPFLERAHIVDAAEHMGWREF